MPRCRACGGGPLKPRVVFFGDAVEPETHRAATAASDDGADAVLVVGSSVSTFSAFRLVRDAARRDVPVAILTKGETRADALAALKVERLAGQTLPLVLERARVLKRTDTDEDTRSTARDARVTRARYVDDSYIRYVISHVQY